MFTITALITLALGIGTMSAIFGVVYGVILQPLPFNNPDRLVRVQQTLSSANDSVRNATYDDYLDWKTKNHVFENLSGSFSQSLIVTGDGEPEMLDGAQVDSDYFRVLKIDPVLGRHFVSEEDHFGSTNSAILSHELWIKRYGGDPAIVGKPIFLNNA